jgi:hypothetical protein
VFERKILRKIFGRNKEDNGNWRIKINIELDELIKHRNEINYVKAQRLSWFGHINRMPETSIIKKIHKRKPFTGSITKNKPSNTTMYISQVVLIYKLIGQHVSV